MRFEDEKFFDTARRLATWQKNNFNNKNNSENERDKNIQKEWEGAIR